ncbi:glycine betaine ABC transporter substrate-binding protein [Spirabiliibacterium pneumoniae]|uniref:glycine betaine ABC transporter substrate-binding protein n=1 Tax=Spirabiliibacterium pneumoniae TaxID=221400 RepID=UPI001AADD36A|nr:glycine betaine ABC transporter substrate-binding protein [Spirabiliibacterium pneumoniae]
MFKKLFYFLFLSLFLLLTACQEKDKIRIATKPMTEQFILSEMLGILIRQEIGVDVEITKGIGGGTANIHPAILKGDFDLYPEYTGTAWLYVLKKQPITNPELLLNELKKEYKEKYNLEWVGIYGFNNTFGLAVRSDYASQYKIKSYSDLVKYSPGLIFGAEYDFF